MKNRILIAVILILPLGLFVYFWQHPGAEQGPAAGGTNLPPNTAAPPKPPAGKPEPTNLPPGVVRDANSSPFRFDAARGVA